MDDVSNQFERMEAAHLGSKWQNYAKNMGSTTRKPLPTLQNRMELPNVQTGQYAKGYAQSSQKPVFPKNSGQNSHVQSPISKIAARQALSTTGLPTEALYGRKPDVSHLIAIGTRAFVHMPKKK